jgi:molybdopterin-guanine dinucleotide biosynthesis protein B
MRVFAVYGFSKSGKTTTVVEIIKDLRARGYSVSTIKDIHVDDFTLDVVGKDTWRHWKAGAEIIGISTVKESIIMIKKSIGVFELMNHFNTDYIILEGFRNVALPKILCAKNEKEMQEDIQTGLFCISGVVSTQLSKYLNLPVINALSDVSRLVDLIEVNSLKLS